jgi:hypothetical protein
MEQRRLRLGDILDDYCPRERRVTNHAVVAMVEDDVKQTRCTTCDAEHPYKGGKAPRRRKKDAQGTLYKEVLASLPEAETSPVLTSPVSSDTDNVEPRAAAREQDLRDEAGEEQEAAQQAGDVINEVVDVEGPVHRPLIRATLPRPEGQKDARPLPDFTVRYGGRGNGPFRGDRTKQRGSGPNGNRGQGGARFAGGRPGHGRSGGGRGPGGGFRSPQQPRQGGKKRSR